MLRLPAYSPDFNPIEMAISKIKALPRKLSRRTIDPLQEAIGVAINSITARDAEHFMRHCGYARYERAKNALACFIAETS